MYNPDPAETEEPRNRHERRADDWAANHPDRIVRPREAEQLTGYCDVHLRRLEAQGKFPKRFKLTPGSGPYGACGWLMSTIQRHIAERAAAVA